MSKPKSLANFLLASMFILGLQVGALAQNTLSAKTGGIPTQPANPAAESDRARDGLAGPVRRVRTEIAKLANVGGRSTEEKRSVLEVAAYDMKGAKTENQYFPVAASTLTGREVYKYDEKGNISEMTVVNDNGSLLSKEVYKYDYDSVGNWTKMTTSVAVIEAGNVTFEPTEVTYRSIMYYLDENMLKLSQPGAAPANAVASGSNTAVKNSPEIKSPSTNPADAKSQPAASNSKAPVNTRNAVHKKAPALPNARPLSDGSAMYLTAGLKLTGAEFTKEPVVMSSEPPPPPTTKAPPKQISGGALNGRAVTLPPPVYPEPARRARMSGMVTVEVVVDETGKVISAQASGGPAMLRDAAIQAAMKARFSPTMLSGQPVKVSGTINYNFTLAQ